MSLGIFTLELTHTGAVGERVLNRVVLWMREVRELSSGERNNSNDCQIWANLKQNCTTNYADYFQIFLFYFLYDINRTLFLIFENICKFYCCSHNILYFLYFENTCSYLTNLKTEKWKYTYVFIAAFRSPRASLQRIEQTT